MPFILAALLLAAPAPFPRTPPTNAPPPCPFVGTWQGYGESLHLLPSGAMTGRILNHDVVGRWTAIPRQGILALCYRARYQYEEAQHEATLRLDGPGLLVWRWQNADYPFRKRR